MKTLANSCSYIELALLPQGTQVLQYMQPDSPDVLSVCCGERHHLHCGALKHRREGKRQQQKE